MNSTGNKESKQQNDITYSNVLMYAAYYNICHPLNHAIPQVIRDSLNCLTIFTQPPHLFDTCLVSRRLCLFT